MTRSIQIMLLAGLGVCILPAQQPAAGGAAQAESPADRLRPTYVLGPGDQVVIRAFELEEINNTFRIDSEGDINLPVLGKIRAGGFTIEQFEAELLTRLKTVVRSPQVSVNVVQYRSDPVFIQGAFKAPGIYTLQGRRTLREMLASTGGLLPTASRRITITRRSDMGPIPLPNVTVDPERKVSTVEISIAKLRENISPVEDIVLQAMDVISVEKAEPVYVDGEVNKVGAVELGERDSISLVQLISMVGGLSKDAAPDKARILRPILNTSRRAEIRVDLKKIMAAKERDFAVLPNDVLYVPKSSRGAATGRISLIALPVATTLIYVLVSRL